MSFHRMRRILLALAVALASTGFLRAQEGGAGGIRGTVIDKDFDAPLAAVRVTVVGTSLVGITSAEGKFLLEKVPAGTYTVAFSKEGYERQIVPSVAVRPGQLTELRVELGSETVEMEELVVTGTDLLSNSEFGLLDIRAEAVTLQDSISADLIQKAGATDVASALKLVVGATVTEGKYATVRGLSDRYTGTTLNGVRIPSADPRRRAVPMDLFPTGTLDSVSVSKTFSPELQGDFTGGGVDIRTKSVPEQRFLRFSLSGEYNSEATGNEEFLTYEGGGVDRLGFDTADRALPGEADDPLPENFPRFRSSPSAEDIAASQSYDRLVRSFEPVMGVSTDAPGLNGGFSIVGGNGREWDGGGRLGFMAAVTYSHKYDFYQDGQNNNGEISVADSGIALVKARTDTRGTEELLAGLLGSVSWRPREKHELSLKLIGNLSSEDEARYQEQDLGASLVEQNQSLHYTERKVGSLQIHGDHHFGESEGPALKWFLADNTTRQDEPDVRFFRNIFSEETLLGEKPANSTEPQNTRRIWREILEKDRQASGDFSLPFRQWSDLPSQLKAGLFVDRSDRTFDQRSFTYFFANQFRITDPRSQENAQKARFQAEFPGQLWTDVFLDPDRIGIASNHPPAPNQLLWYIGQMKDDDVDYTGDQNFTGLYATGEVPFSRRLKGVLGVRRETTELSVIPTNDFSGRVEVIEIQPSGDRGIVEVPQQEATADVSDASLLPAMGLIVDVAANMKVRMNFGRTVARPTFRELAPVATEEFIFGDEYVGNPDLIVSKINNYDLRWEWFPRPGEVLSASAFYKQIQDPIEQISFSAGGRTFIQPVNYDRGKVRGFELEARASLSRIAATLADFSAGLNFTSLNSQVDVPLSEQESLAPFGLDEPTRRLQGQPAYVANLNFTYDNDRAGTSAGLFYNRVGEILLTGAARGENGGVPNVFEEPFDQLDFTFSQKLRRGVSLSFKARNLIQGMKRTVYRTPDGEEEIKTERSTPLLIGFGASWTW